MVRPVETENAPCSTASTASLRISFISSGVGGRSWLRPTALRISPWPTWGAMLRLMPLELSLSAQPSRSVQVQSGARNGQVDRWNSARWGSAATGNGDELQFPVTSVVTPWYALLSPPESNSMVVSECECMSMNPGATTSPVASIVRAASASPSLPIAAIRPASMAMSASYRGLPVPSITVPFLMSVSNIARPLRRLSAAC